jgi:hypothetical protein
VLVDGGPLLAIVYAVAEGCEDGIAVYVDRVAAAFRCWLAA